MSKQYSAKHRYLVHRNHSKLRNIDFLLTFEEWNNWWLSHGVDKNQATKRNDKNQPCMCRYEDTGPYSLDNIYYATRSQNVFDLHKNKSPCLGKEPWNKGKNNPKISGENHWSYGLKAENNPNSKRIQTPAGIFASRREAAKHYQLDDASITYRMKTKPKEYYYV